MRHRNWSTPEPADGAELHPRKDIIQVEDPGTLKTLVIGRSPFADIVIADATVAPHHAELIIADDERLYIVDCASAGGTWRHAPAAAKGVGDGDDAREWRRVRQAFIAVGEPLRLGEHRCTAETLLRAARDAPANAPRGGASPAGMATAGASPSEGGRQPLRGRVERDATTGEIVRRRP